MEISHEDFLMFIDRALDGMLRIVEELGEERANMRPDLPGANSPYAILTHCIGVCDYWIGTLLGKREFFRDRDAEFKASGTIDELRERVWELKAQLLEDIRQVQGGKPLASAPTLRRRVNGFTIFSAPSRSPTRMSTRARRTLALLASRPRMRRKSLIAAW